MVRGGGCFSVESTRSCLGGSERCTTECAICRACTRHGERDDARKITRSRDGRALSSGESLWRRNRQCRLRHVERADGIKKPSTTAVLISCWCLARGDTGSKRVDREWPNPGVDRRLNLARPPCWMQACNECCDTSDMWCRHACSLIIRVAVAGERACASADRREDARISRHVATWCGNVDATPKVRVVRQPTDSARRCDRHRVVAVCRREVCRVAETVSRRRNDNGTGRTCLRDRILQC